MSHVIRRTSSLTEADLRALWRLRLSLIDLKPSVTPEQDFEAFAEDFRWPGYVWIQYDKGEVGGFFLQRGVPVTWGGEELMCLLPEYGFIAAHLRGGSVMPLAAALITALSAARHPWRRKFVAASTYPPGYIAFRRAVTPFWTLHDGEVPAWERGLLLHLAERVSGEKFQADGTVIMRTLPRPAQAPRSEAGQRLFAEYERLNPDWREGRGLFFLFPVGAGTLARAALHALDRLR